MKNKKLLILVSVFCLALILVVLPLLAACEEEGPPAEEEGPPAEEEGPPAEEEVIELTYGALYSPGNFFADADVLWIEWIEEQTDGRVHITPYWGATMISRAEGLEDVINGVCDIGHVEPAAGKYGGDVHKKSFMFYWGIPNELRIQIYHEVLEKFPEYEAEQSEVLKILGHTPGVVKQLFICENPISSLDDLAGLVLRGVGEQVDLLAELGAEGVSIPMGEMYTALSKGTVDGGILAYESLLSAEFAECVKYVYVLDLSGPPTPSRAMNLDSWNSLPSDIQEIFEESCDYWDQAQLQCFVDAEVAGYAYGEEMGVIYDELPAAELAEFYDLVEAMCIAAAAELDAMGYPGTEIYQEIRRLAAEYM